MFWYLNCPKKFWIDGSVSEKRDKTRYLDKSGHLPRSVLSIFWSRFLTSHSHLKLVGHLVFSKWILWNYFMYIFFFHFVCNFVIFHLFVIEKSGIPHHVWIVFNVIREKCLVIFHLLKIKAPSGISQFSSQKN